MISGDGSAAGRMPYNSVSAATIPPAQGKILQIAAELAFGVPFRRGAVLLRRIFDKRRPCSSRLTFRVRIPQLAEAQFNFPGLARRMRLERLWEILPQARPGLLQGDS